MKISLPKNFDPPKPLKIYDYQDVAIILFASSIQSKQFSLKILQQEEVIPLDWQLRKPAQQKGGSSSFSFLQGLNISIFPGKIIFAKKVTNTTVDLPKIVQQFLSKFNSYNYSRAQMIFRRLITLPNKENSAANFIQHNLLNGLDWDILGQKPIKRQVNYFYKNSPYDLTINVLDLQIKNKKINAKSCLFFRGIFNYKPNLDHEKKQNNYFLSVVEKYPENITLFNQIVENDLLNT